MEVLKYLNLMKQELQDNGEITLSIKVLPKSQKTGITEIIDEEVIKIKVNAAPEKGKANKEVIEILSKEFGIRKSDIEIIVGDTTQNKLIKLYLN